MLLERDGLVDQCAVQLGKFISAKEPNTRYLGLENMGRLSALPQVAAAVRRNQPQIAESLHDPDISIRRRALDLLYGMCDASNAQGIVQQLLDYLVVSDFAIREELVLKIAILAEKFAPVVQQAQRWYVDVVLALIDKAGDFVSDDIWCACARTLLVKEAASLTTPSLLPLLPCQAPGRADSHKHQRAAALRGRASAHQAASRQRA